MLPSGFYRLSWAEFRLNWTGLSLDERSRKETAEAMTHLPNPSNAGGTKFGEELLVFCKEFRPTTSELRRLLIKMGTHWAIVSQRFQGET
ncbi:hypothetical protein NFI96_029959 [Prochilodus magdalenae]|nr:hypothetical protein NFI96_029959 [Prochilodus magdalenae]